MRPLQLLLSLVCIGFALGTAGAAEPVTVELRKRASVGVSVALLRDVALISGGDAATRARIGRIDIAELKSRESTVQLGRRSVEYRLLLAGFEATAVRVTGAERSTIALAKRPVTAEEVATVAKAELLRHVAGTPGTNTVELALPVLVKLPEVPANEPPVITAKPRGAVPASGRVQMDVSVSSSNEQLLSFAIHLEVKPAVQPSGLVPTGANQTQPAQAAFVIRPRQRVTMEVRSGGLIVKAVGEAQQQGRLGESILVQNVDSKKAIVARITGPSTVEVDIGGTP